MVFKKIFKEWLQAFEPRVADVMVKWSFKSVGVSGDTGVSLGLGVRFWFRE